MDLACPTARRTSSTTPTGPCWSKVGGSTSWQCSSRHVWYGMRPLRPARPPLDPARPQRRGGQPRRAHLRPAAWRGVRRHDGPRWPWPPGSSATCQAESLRDRRPRRYSDAVTNAEATAGTAGPPPSRPPTTGGTSPVPTCSRPHCARTSRAAAWPSTSAAPTGRAPPGSGSRAQRTVSLDIDPRGLGSDGVCGSALALPFEDGAFDVVSAFDVIEHCDPEATALVGGAPGAAPGRPVRHVGARLLVGLERLRRRQRPPPPLHDRPRAVAAVERAGFTVDRVTYGFATVFPMFAAERVARGS